ncbi:MAG: hypothetical protein ACR2PG_18570 [Hyphomicrobiaceae bacterium]
MTKESLLAMCSDALPGVPIKDDIELEIDRKSGRLSFKVRRYAYGQLVGLKRFVGKCRLT